MQLKHINLINQTNSILVMKHKKYLSLSSQYFSQAWYAATLEQQEQYQDAMNAWYLAMECAVKIENMHWCRVRAERCKRMANPD